MTKFERDLYDELVKRKLLPEEILRKVAEECERTNIPFIYYLVDKKYIEEEILLTISAEVGNIPFINLKEITVEESAIKSVPVRFCWHYQFLPVKLENKTLTVAVSNPLSIQAQDEIRLNLGFNISMVLAKRNYIIEMIKTYYGVGAETVDQLISYGGERYVHQQGERTQTIENIERRAEDASVAKLVNQIILDAYKKRATDIHIEPYRQKLRLRYRIDGVLFEQNVHEEVSNFIQAIFSRIKIMANLNIVEHRLPQDGRAIVKTADQILDLRISFLPTPHGQSLVIRILPMRMVFSLEKLGFFPEDLRFIESAIRRPNGIIFVTGPTGSGKTTTLYACLKKINRVEKKIITVEDPVEYELEDITQVQVNPEVGLTFAKGLRSILRHDPDVIMVGEVRDRETAEIAIRVALTGHLVFSTLHTNDAAGGITRLIDIGIEPYLVASSVYAFIAQRLVRIICSQCKEEIDDVGGEISEEISSVVGGGKVVISRGRGCEQCNYTGFYGRTAIYEILVVDKDIRELIVDKATASVIREEAIKKGMRTLRENGWLKVIQEITTPWEVMSVCEDMKFEVVDKEKKVNSDLYYVSPHREEKDRVCHLNQGEKRVFMRVPYKIPVRVALVEKGEGEVIKITKQVLQNIEYEKVDNEEFLQEMVTEEVKDVELNVDVFTTTINLSAGGLVFESQYLFPIDTILELKIYLPADRGSVQCFAKVVRVEKDLPRCFYIATCFLDMSSEHRSKINEFVKKEISKQRFLNLDIHQGD
ncbi:MAG: hypothetical protein B6D56_05130 [Candidatus Omnitrophica bacterium 4484_70.1]|nr:MAG: hypothetical protein B6D56_05130 [Candidatus Omnitrophica bacterium 4484_70.1]